MKRETIIFVSLCIALLISGCSTQQAKQIDYISAETAKSVVLEAVGATAEESRATTVGMDTRGGMDYYQVKFTANGESYIYDVDALSGVIIDYRQITESSKDITGQVPTEDSLVTDADTFSSATVPLMQSVSSLETNGDAVISVSPPQVPAQGAQSTMISVEEAKRKALAHAGLSSDKVTFVKSRLERDNGTQTYDIEFYSSSFVEYDYEIDPYTGEILSFDFDAEYYTPPSSGSNGAGTITKDEAKHKALAQVPGATLDHIAEFKTDYDDGRLEYEGKIYYNGMEYEFEIDGYSGAIRSWDAEPIYD